MVVDYEERDSTNELSVHERLALWLVADVFLLTPIREGLNLMPLEYIYTRRELPNAGAVVVSEFSTCSALLNGSLKVSVVCVGVCMYVFVIKKVFGYLSVALFYTYSCSL